MMDYIYTVQSFQSVQHFRVHSRGMLSPVCQLVFDYNQTKTYLQLTLHPHLYAHTTVIMSQQLAPGSKGSELRIRSQSSHP